jgi:hypothetical protein
MNGIAIAALIPTIIVVVPSTGAIGAAWIWVVLNAVYLVVTVQLMHRRLLPGDQWPWYRRDVAAPVSAALATALLARLIVPNSRSIFVQSLLLAICCLAVLLSAVAVAPIVRGWLFGTTRRWVSFAITRVGRGM